MAMLTAPEPTAASAPAATPKPSSPRPSSISIGRVSSAPKRSWPKPIWTLIVLTRFLRGYRQFLRTGVTPPEAYADMRRLFRLTNGRFNDIMARATSLMHPAGALPGRAGVLGDMPAASLAGIVAELRQSGFHQFNPGLPLDLCDRLRSFALRAPCQVHPPPPGGGPLHRFDPDHVIGTRYQVERQALHENHDVQRLLIDMSLLSVAQGYLNCRPVCLGCDMWWSTAYSDQASGEAAQLYHFDMSQIKFLKIFTYLTDVETANGPHAFVLGSHRRAPKSLLEDRRFSDDEIQRLYPGDRILSVAGPAGSIFAEDTRGIHKGTPLKHGHRLILQFLFATSGFGEMVPPVRMNDRFLPEFVGMTRRHPRMFAHAFKETAA